jgi:hypothetical protein
MFKLPSHLRRPITLTDHALDLDPPRSPTCRRCGRPSHHGLSGGQADARGLVRGCCCDAGTCPANCDGCCEQYIVTGSGFGACAACLNRSVTHTRYSGCIWFEDVAGGWDDGSTCGFVSANAQIGCDPSFFSCDGTGCPPTPSVTCLGTWTLRWDDFEAGSSSCNQDGTYEVIACKISGTSSCPVGTYRVQGVCQLAGGCPTVSAVADFSAGTLTVECA